ncbi:MAG: ABC transporter substrate-binding protein [Microbacterium gubbeenense]
MVDELIEEFEAQNEGITVTQTNVPDPFVALQTRLARGDVPDVIGMNLSVMNDISSQGILRDLSGTVAADAVANEGAQEYVNQLSGADGIAAVPWSLNAVGVLYDVDQFEELGVEEPTTWSELLDVAAAVEGSDRDPFFFTWLDAWTATAPFNAMAGALQGPDFWDELVDGSATISDSDAYGTAAENMLALRELGNSDPFGMGYDDGNAAFADGDAVMYPQGIWALPVIADINPDKNIGIFPLPATDNPDDTALVSGPDSVLAISEDTSEAEAAQEFVDFLMSAEAQQTFTEDQFLISVRDDVQPTNPALAALKSDWLDAARTGIYPDSMTSGSSNMTAILQDFLQDGDVDSFLARLDDDFEQYSVR